ncbi:MAG: hypothetical protein CMF49_03530 [Legionellales bacterium]|nr:hypothetical protein [Legionellales bacterium]
MRKVMKAIRVGALWLPAMLSTNVWASSSAIWDNSGAAITNMSDLTGDASKGFSWMFKLGAAGLCLAVLLVAGYHTLSAFHEAREKGSYVTFAVWFIIAIFLVGLVVVLGTTAFSSATDIASIDNGG